MLPKFGLVISVKFLILFLAFLSVFCGSLILGISDMIHAARCQQKHVIHQQIEDSHKLHDWRLR